MAEAAYAWIRKKACKGMARILPLDIRRVSNVTVPPVAGHASSTSRGPVTMTGTIFGESTVGNGVLQSALFVVRIDGTL